jgi:hypothetical protein
MLFCFIGDLYAKLEMIMMIMMRMMGEHPRDAHAHASCFMPHA